VLSPVQEQNLRALCEKYFIARLWLFGSAATDKFDPESSDIDLLVEFGEPKDMSPAAQYFDFWEELKALFGRHVDLVERKAIRNPHFLASINGRERLLYAA